MQLDEIGILKTVDYLKFNHYNQNQQLKNPFKKFELPKGIFVSLELSIMPLRHLVPKFYPG
jgi:hypothetical protein